MLPKLKELSKMRNAKGQLCKLAQGKYHHLRYEIGEHHTGAIQEECTVYIDEYDFSSDRTWDEALKKIRRQIEENK